MFGNVVCIMTTRTVSIDWRRGIRVVYVHGAAKTICTRVASSIDLVGGCDAWCGWFVNLECKYVNVIAMVLQGVRSCAAVIVVCLGRCAISAVWSMVLTQCVSFDCVLGLL